MNVITNEKIRHCASKSRVFVQNCRNAILKRPFLGLLLGAALNSQNDDNKDMAASIAFFSFFSMFPLLLGIIAIGSLFFDAENIQHTLGQLLDNLLPASAKLVSDNVDALYRLRSAAGVTSLVGLLWSASKMSAAISRGINLALKHKNHHAFYVSPLRNLGMTLIISLLLFSCMALTTANELIVAFELELLGHILNNLLNIASGHLASYLIATLILLALYRFIPYRAPSFNEILPGAVVAGLLYELGKSGFLLYLNYVAKFEAVYGSLSSIIVLLLWLYFSAYVLLYGAEIIHICQQRNIGSTI